MDWQPSASLATLKKRAQLIRAIRQFFYDRNSLEVDTPLLGATTVTDPYIESLKTTEGYYLQTSPEFFMKRLLASGSGDIFSLGKAFRAEEQGRLHHQEFTLLEWYRVGYDHFQLMEENDQLLQALIQSKPAEKVSYADLFKQHLNIDPHHASLENLYHCAERHHLHKVAIAPHSRDEWLHLLLTHCIEPKLGKDKPCFIYHYPASQAALAKIICVNGTDVAARFELYIDGVEIANGFYELTDAEEQARRFQDENTRRQAQCLPLIPIDHHFLSALQHGLPSCAGVALGVDRLLLAQTKQTHIKEVSCFSIEQPVCL